MAAYRVSEKMYVKEMDSRAMVLEHVKSSARVFLVSSEDEDKAFYIGFRIPPGGSTGLPHTLKHSVLGGSDKLPVRDPFVELVKGSLNTFLDTVTYPDKTVHPVASYNDKGFRNLVDVYLGGTLHPAIYRKSKISLQEGRHHELESPEDELIISGVICNKMKDTFSPPESVLDRFTGNVLFPDTIYSNESGGDPVVIPQLTYKEFIAFRGNYCHPASSYIYLCRGIDMAQKLTWLNREYLGCYGRKDCHADFVIATQQPLEQPIRRKIAYSIIEEEGVKDRTYPSISTMMGTSLEPVLYMAFQILEYTLISAPGTTLRQVLIGAGVGQDILGGYDCGILQPYFSVIAKNTSPRQGGELLAIVKGVLRKLADQETDKKSLSTRLNLYEFHYRKTDHGSAPKGLIYDLWSLDSWLCDREPTLHLKYQKTLDYLKEAMEEGYLEQLIHRYLLDNPHEAVITACPRVNRAAGEDRNLTERLKAYKESLDGEKLEILATQTRQLKEYQEEPLRQGGLEKTPMLQREDIERKDGHSSYEIKAEDGVTVIHSDLFTFGIEYLKVLFGISRMLARDLPYTGLLETVLGYVGTEYYGYGGLTSGAYLNSRGVSFAASSYPDTAHPRQSTGAFVASAEVLYRKLDFTLSILSEILTQSKLDDEKRPGEILDETRSRTRMEMGDAFHSAAVSETSSYFSASATFNDIAGGTGYYQLLEGVSRRSAEGVSYERQLIAKLKDVYPRLPMSNNPLVVYIVDAGGYSRLPTELKVFQSVSGQGDGKAYELEFGPDSRGEGFKTASQVSYVARCGSFAGKEVGGKKLEYAGVLRVLKVIMNYEYLQMNSHIKGGAYGYTSSFSCTGDGRLVPYRDPNLEATDQVHEGIPDYLRNFSIDRRNMAKYVISAMSDVDMPLTPSLKDSRNLSTYLSGVADKMVQKEREQILDMAREDMEVLVDIVQAMLDTRALCVIGNDEQICIQKGMFGEVKNPYHQF